MISKTDKLLKDLLKLHPKYIDLSLERLKKLLHKLGNPHLDLPRTIHIAGTNGKGSVQSFIRNILISNGYSCDAYISPHLSKFNERIILNNKEVSTIKLCKTLEFVKKINNNNPITFFEITTAVAFVLFQKSNSEFLILETGLGGRLDATNIIKKKLCSIITPISYDHEEFLGNTIYKITKEKLGIIKNSEYIIISKQKKEVDKIIKKKLLKFKNVYYFGKDYKIKELNNKKFRFEFNNKNKIVNKPNLNGSHQIENASVALVFSEIMLQKKLILNFSKSSKAILKTSWPARLEILKFYNKKIIIDGSHNIDGAIKLNEFLLSKKMKPVVIFGMLNNKRIDIFLKTIRKNIKEIIPVKIPNEKNSFLLKEIYEKCDLLSINYLKVNNMNNAIKYIIKSDQKVFLVTGSLYLAGKIRTKFL